MGFGAGMGLPNIKKYSDELEIETEPGKGMTLRAVIYLRD
jgi:anti-sigma regulatory factor (Ser/Thr protein kinase)